ncbi:hypothetical protein HK102_008550, partial [Quaeritorhiza haematococci]
MPLQRDWDTGVKGVNAQDESTIVKIGFMYSAAPSYTDPVMYEDINVNERLLPAQALVEYWNSHEEYYPSNIKFELVYGAHGLDV